MARFIVLFAAALALALPASAETFTNSSNGQGAPGSVVLCRTTAAIYLPCDAATPLPTSAPNGGVPTLAYSGPTSASVGTTSGVLAAAAAYSRALSICTLPTSTTNVWLRPDGGTAAPNTGIPVYAGGGCASFGSSSLPMPSAAITAITDGGVAQTVTLAGG